jgi:hypothetical protein
MSGLNSAAAIVSGVGSEWVVVRAGSRKAPFVLAVGVLVVAAGVIWWFWVSCFWVVFFAPFPGGYHAGAYDDG